MQYWIAVAKIISTPDPSGGDHVLHPPEGFVLRNIFGFTVAQWEAWAGASICYELQRNSLPNQDGTEETFYTRGSNYLCDEPGTRYFRLRALRYDVASGAVYYSGWTSWLSTTVPEPTFLGLVDTPSEFAGHADEFLIVNGDENTLDFTSVAPGSASVDWENVVVVAKSGGDYTTIQGGANVASAIDLLLVMSGNYAENVTLNDQYLTLYGLGGSSRSGLVRVSGSDDDGPLLTASNDVAVAGVFFTRTIEGTGSEYFGIDASSDHYIHLVECYIRLDDDGYSRDITAVKIAGQVSGDLEPAEIQRCLITVLGSGAGTRRAIELSGGTVEIEDTQIEGDVVAIAATSLRLKNCLVDGALTGMAGASLVLDNCVVTGAVSGWDSVGGTFMRDAGGYYDWHIQSQEANQPMYARVAPTGTVNGSNRSTLMAFFTDWLNDQTNYEAVEVVAMDDGVDVIGVVRTVAGGTGTLRSLRLGVGGDKASYVDIDADGRVTLPNDLDVDDNDINNVGDVTIVGGKKLIVEGTTGDGEVYTSSDDVYIVNTAQDKDIYVQVNDGGVTSTAIFVDGASGNVTIGEAVAPLITGGERNLSIRNTSAGSQVFLELHGNVTTNVAVDSISFINEASSETYKRIAQFSAVRDNHDNAGAMEYRVWDSAGSVHYPIRFSSEGYVTIGSNTNAVDVLKVEGAALREGWFMGQPDLQEGFDGTLTDIDIDTEIRKDTDYYTHSSGSDNITIIKTGWYRISYCFLLDGDLADRQGVRVGVYDDGTLISGSRSTTYIRYNTYGRESSVVNSFLCEIAASSILDFRTDAFSGTGAYGDGTNDYDILADSQVTIERVDQT
jgi:hypothetical protein